MVQLPGFALSSVRLVFVIFEAPASASGHFTRTNYHESRNVIMVLSLLSLLLYGLDMLFQVWLFGVYDEDRALKNAHDEHRENGRDTGVNNDYCVQLQKLNKLMLARLLIICCMFIDVLIPVYADIQKWGQ